MNTEEHQSILDGSKSTQSFSERRFGLSTPRFLIISGVILAIIFYLSVLIFGNNSLSVLLSLEEHQEFLSEDIEHLKKENAALQKQYFELKELDSDPQIDKEGETP